MSFGKDVLRQTLITTIASFISLILLSVVVAIVIYFLIQQIQKGLPSSLGDLIGL